MSVALKFCLYIEITVFFIPFTTKDFIDCSAVWDFRKTEFLDFLVRFMTLADLFIVIKKFVKSTHYVLDDLVSN